MKLKGIISAQTTDIKTLLFYRNTDAMKVSEKTTAQRSELEPWLSHVGLEAGW